jgi:hypothetical protein
LGQTCPGQLKLLGRSEQFDYALEQAPAATTIQAAVIEAQRELCFSSRDKFVPRFVPDWLFLPGAETEEKCLIR